MMRAQAPVGTHLVTGLSWGTEQSVERSLSASQLAPSPSSSICSEGKSLSMIPPWMWRQKRDSFGAFSTAKMQ